LKGKRILQISCAFGNVSEKIAESCARQDAEEFVLTDIMQSEVDNAQRKLKKFGKLCTFLKQDATNLDFEDHATCIVKCKSGTTVTLNVGWFARYHRVQVDLYGTVKHVSATSKSPSLIDYAKKIFRSDTSSGFYKELEYFVNCVSSDVTPIPSGEEGLEDLKLISTAYKNTF